MPTRTSKVWIKFEMPSSYPLGDTEWRVGWGKYKNLRITCVHKVHKTMILNGIPRERG